jgi:DNA-binding IclR family transcriptional regulator
LKRFTESTITNRSQLEKQLEAIRRDGYGFSAEELEVGLIAVAAPIMAVNASVVASVGVSGPAFRLKRESIPKIGELTKVAAAQISRNLGFRDS